jgi:thiamine-phosphate pyrophosphorylase
VILHLITDRLRLVGDTSAPFEGHRCLMLQARYAIDAGVDVLQVRERDMDGAALAALVTDLVALARGSRTSIVVNDRVDVALACGAAGVHLRADSVPARAVRAIAPAGFLIGRSVHGVDDAEAAREADYLIAGTVWPTASKAADHPLLGVDGLAAVVRAAQVPVLAVGGVAVPRIAEAAACGAAGAAAIGMFMGPPGAAGTAGCRAVSLVEVAQAARRAFDTFRSAS